MDPVRETVPAAPPQGINRGESVLNTLVTDLDQVDDVPGQPSTSSATIRPGCLSRRTRIQSSHRQQAPPKPPAGRATSFGSPSRARSQPIAIRWMMCQDSHPPPPPSSCSFCLSRTPVVPPPKNADGRPLAGSSPSTKGLMHLPSATCSASGRHHGNHPIRQAFPNPHQREQCAATADRGPDGSCKRLEILGRWIALGGGRHPRFCGGGCGPHGAALRPCTDPPDRDL
jgi:hypothetical protein